MREGFEIISGGKTGRMLLIGAFIALAAALAVTFATRESANHPNTASADSLLAPSNAPSEAGYIKIGDIKGESTDDRHKDWIDVVSFSHSVSVPVSASASGTTRGKAAVRDFIITKGIDKASPLLMQAALSGTVIPTIEFEVSRPGAREGEPYLKYELKEVLITSYRTSGSTSGDAIPMESIALNFSEIRVVYTEQRPDGSAAGTVEAGWNVRENRAK